MLSSPYPVPSLRVWRVAMVVGWLAGVGAGAWVIVEPPKSYEGLGLALTITWGIMLALGSALVLVGHLARSYQIELPGLVLALGGVAIYDFLSWQATFGDSPGSGPRALLLVVLLCFLIARIRTLAYFDGEARRMIDLREADE